MTRAAIPKGYRLQCRWCDICVARKAQSLSIDDPISRHVTYEIKCQRKTWLSPSCIACFVVFLFSILAANVTSGEPLNDSGLPQSFSMGSGDFLVMQATIDGREYSCMLDTGASCTVLDTSLASLARGALSTTSITSEGGTIAAQLLASPEIRLGTFVVPSGQQCVCMDLSLLRMLTGRDIRGVLGPRSFENIIIQTDVDSGLLRLLPPKSDALVNLGVPTRIRLDRNFRPFVVARIGNLEQETLIDTGTLPIAIGTAVSPSMIADASIRVISRRDYGSLTGARKTSEYVLERLAIGDWSATSLYAYEGHRCRIGLQYLSRFVVTIDFPNQMLYLRPSKGYALPEVFDMCGLSVGRFSGVTVVSGVVDKSPANRAQITRRDHLLELNGRDVSAMQLADVRRLLGIRHGERIDLLIDHDGRERRVSLELEDPRILPWHDSN